MNENYQFYLYEAVNEDELRKMLAERDEVKRSTDDRVLEAWYYDTNNEKGVIKGVQQWNLEHRGSRGDVFWPLSTIFPLIFSIIFPNWRFQVFNGQKTVKKIFFSNSENRFLLIGVRLVYVWNIVAKLAKLKKKFFFREHPTNS